MNLWEVVPVFFFIWLGLGFIYTLVMVVETNYSSTDTGPLWRHILFAWPIFLAVCVIWFVIWLPPTLIKKGLERWRLNAQT